MAYKNPADAAMPYMQQVPGTITPYYQKYIDSGGQALSDLQKQYSTLLNDPAAIMKMIGSGYQQSPGYGYLYNQDMNAANSAAASGGMLGTPYHQENAASMANNLASQDYNNYVTQALGQYDRGLSGEEGLNAQGYNASNELATGLATNLNNEAGLAYNGQANQNAHDASFWNSIISGGAALAGGLLGGPMGAATGGAIGSAMSPNGGGGNSAPQLQGYGSNQMGGGNGQLGASNGMGGAGGTQQDFMTMLSQAIAQYFHQNPNAMSAGSNTAPVGGYS